LQTGNTLPKKSSSTSKWLIGCGIGCGVIVLIVVILAISGFFFVKNIVQEFEEAETLMETLTERYGQIKDFCPEPDGTIKPEQMETFLAVREAMAPVREKLEMSFDVLARETRGGQMEEPPPSVFTKIKTGIELAPLIGELYRSRTQALLDAGMGMGEYYYIYVVSYYSWLGKSPADSPGVRVGDQDERRGVVVWDDEEDEEESLERRLRRLHRQILPMLHNQYEKLTEGGVSGVGEAWRKKLGAEIEAMESDRFRLLWQDGLPKVLEDSLKPYRSRLEASYSKTLNPFEIAYIQRRKR